MGLFDLMHERGEKPRAGLQGFPQLTADEIIQPTDLVLQESASVFTEIETKRAVRIWVNGSRRVFRAVPARMRQGGAEIIARGGFIPSVNGALDLFAPGLWYINTPIVTAEGTPLNAMISDAAFAAAGIVGTEEYTAQTPIWGTATRGAVNNGADTAILAANLLRRALMLFNDSPLGGAGIAFTVENPAPAFRGFMILPPKTGYLWSPNEYPTQQVIRAWADAAGAFAIWNEAT